MYRSQLIYCGIYGQLISMYRSLQIYSGIHTQLSLWNRSQLNYCGIHTPVISMEQITADLLWYSYLADFYGPYHS